MASLLGPRRRDAEYDEEVRELYSRAERDLDLYLAASPAAAPAQRRRAMRASRGCRDRREPTRRDPSLPAAPSRLPRLFEGITRLFLSSDSLSYSNCIV